MIFPGYNVLTEFLLIFNNMPLTQTQIIPEEDINNKFQAVVNYEQ